MNCVFKQSMILGLVILGAVISISAQPYTGRATGIRAVTVINGTSTTTVVADTGPLPPFGQNISITAPSAFVTGSTVAGSIASNTAGVLKSSQSASIVNDLDFNVGGVRVRANRIVANATCFCCPGAGEATCVGATSISNLTVTDAAGATTNVIITGQANQVVQLPNGQGTLTINEQSTGFETISVTGLHIVASSGANTYDVRVASVSTGITCSIVAPTPAKVTVSGTVFDASGRTLAGAAVSLADPNGNTRYTRTNSFGIFTFADVEVGQTYIVNVSGKGYQFDPVVLSLTDTVNLDIRALPVTTVRYR